MDRAHRKELKHDRFVEQVGHTLEYTSEHRSQFTRIGVIVLGVALIAAGIYYYRNHQHAVRQEALQQALKSQEAAVGPPNEFLKTFATDAEKDKAIEKEFTDVATRYSSSEEGTIARFYLGTFYADKGKLTEAENNFKQAMTGDQPFASQAGFSLAQLYETQKKYPDAEKILKDLAGNPTVLVSKEQAQLELGKLYSTMGRTAEARKILEPLRTERSAVSRAAVAALSGVTAR